MKVFLCGGGAGNQVIDAYHKLNKFIDHNKPLLYIPLAMEEDKYDSCFDWITNELKFMKLTIKMVRSFTELANLDFNDYCAIFIGGGNTYRLLGGLKSNNSFDKLKEYIIHDGIVFGGSAGAMIFGYDLSSCKNDDLNEINLKDHTGFNILDNISILCHFTNRDKEHDRLNNDFLLSISNNRKSLALPEEDTIYVTDNNIEIIGTKDFYYFNNGQRIRINPLIFNDKYKNYLIKKRMKNIIFDLGGVLLNNTPKEVLLKKIINDDDYKYLINYFDNIKKADYGTISLKEIFNETIPSQIQDKYCDLLIYYYKYRTINIELLNVLNRLHNNYKIYILSDNNREAYDYYKSNELFKNIDGWVISCDYKITKQERKIFDIIINEYNIEPSESYYIDDNIDNINIAKDYGFKTYLFDNNINELLKNMKDNGIEG